MKSSDSTEGKKLWERNNGDNNTIINNNNNKKENDNNKNNNNDNKLTFLSYSVSKLVNLKFSLITPPSHWKKIAVNLECYLIEVNYYTKSFACFGLSNTHIEHTDQLAFAVLSSGEEESCVKEGLTWVILKRYYQARSQIKTL